MVDTLNPVTPVTNGAIVSQANPLPAYFVGGSAAAINAALSPIAVFNTVALTRPAEVVVTVVGGGSGTNYRYTQVAHGAGTTAASPAMTNPVSNAATLDVSHYNSMTGPVVAGVTSYDFYRTQSGSYTSGYIGRAAPGVEFRDTGIASNVATAAPVADTGSAGLWLGGPSVVESAVVNGFGLQQVGNEPHIWTAGDTRGWTSPVSVFTQFNSPFQSAVAIGSGNEMVYRNATGSMLNPTGVVGGAGLIAGENFFNTIQLWKNTAGWEFGGSTGAVSVASDIQGRHQFFIGDGNAGGTPRSSGGLVVGASDTYTGILNRSAIIGTNGIDLRVYRVGYTNTSSSGDLTDYERFDASFAAVSNVLTALSWSSGSGGQITGTTTTPHGLVPGQRFILTGNTPSLYNGAYIAVTGTTASTLVAALTSNPGVNTVLGSASYQGTILNVGPVAGGTGVLRAMKLTGASVSTDGAFTSGGSITSSTPNGGTAGAWKLGIRVAATVILDTTQYVQADIGGTLYKLAIAS